MSDKSKRGSIPPDHGAGVRRRGDRDLAAELDEANQKLDEAKKELARTHAAVRVANLDSDAARRTNASLREELEASRRSNSDQAGRLADPHADIPEELQEARSGAEKAREEAKAAKKKSDKLEKELKESKAGVTRIEKKCSKAERYVERLQGELKEARGEADELREELEKAKRQATTLQADLDQEKLESGRLEGERNSARVEAGRLRADLDQARADAVRNETARHRLEENLDAAQNCRICFDRVRDLVFFPCSHFLVCQACYDRAGSPNTCMYCRAAIHNVRTVFN